MDLHTVAAEAFNLAKTALTGSQVRQYARDMAVAEHMPPAALAEVQRERLTALLGYAYEHTSFYRARFEAARLRPSDIRSAEDLCGLPILTRTDVQQHRDLLRTDLPRRGMELNWTGGSSGAPLRFWQDDRCREYGQAAMLRFRRWHGVARGDKMAFIWPTLRDLPACTVKEWTRQKFTRQRWFNAATLASADIDRIVRALRTWRPRVVISFPSSLHEVARHLLASGIDDIRPSVVESWSEKILDHQREDVEAAFGCKVVDVYASREFYPIAAQCAQFAGHHIAADLRIVELIDDGGYPVPDGTPGRVIVTDLTNYAMPFIRYDTGDIAVRSRDACSCGRTLPVLSSIEGRSSDVFRTKDGAWVCGGVFTPSIVKAGGVAEFQVHQLATAEVIIRLVPLHRGSPPPIEEIRQRLRTAVGDVFDLRFEVVDEIPRLRSGKRRFTISEVSRPAS